MGSILGKIVKTFISKSLTYPEISFVLIQLMIGHLWLMTDKEKKWCNVLKRRPVWCGVKKPTTGELLSFR